MIFLDFETRSEVDLRKVGAHVYAAHPSTKVLCVAWAVDDGQVRLDLDIAHLLAHLDGHALVAHNCEFEREILRAAGVHTWLEQWTDTAAMAALAGFPRGLDELAQALALGQQKDSGGHAVMLKLSKPRRGRASRDDESQFWTPTTKPEDFQRLYDYCRQDVETMREAYHALPDMSPAEREVWLVTLGMNERGVGVDRGSLGPAMALAHAAESDLSERFRSIVGHSPASPRAAAAMGLDSLDKVAVRRALQADNVPPVIREALELRKAVAKSSVKKLHAFDNRTSDDGRVRGQFVYCGAERTGRWSARGTQPQNFPRGLGEGTEAAFEALNAGVLDLLYPDTLGTLSNMLRGFFRGPFLVGDYSQIEARVVAWLAGQNDLLQIFKAGGDPYCEMASAIYGRTITKSDTKERFMGKQAVLGCGYGMGPDKFMRTLDETYDVQVTPDFAERAVYTYRRRFSRIPALWKRLEDFFKFAVGRKANRVQDSVLQIFMGTGHIGQVPVAWIELPSGRKLYYAHPRLVATEYGSEIRYQGRNQFKGGRWEEIHSYGGRLTENVVQAISRDLLAGTMLELDRKGFPLVMTVHDEAVVESDESRLTEFKGCFSVAPQWAAGLPVGAECFTTTRYRK